MYITGRRINTEEEANDLDKPMECRNTKNWYRTQRILKYYPKILECGVCTTFIHVASLEILMLEWRRATCFWYKRAHHLAMSL
jgi:hypothetical protein